MSDEQERTRQEQHWQELAELLGIEGESPARPAKPDSEPSREHTREEPSEPSSSERETAPAEHFHAAPAGDADSAALDRSTPESSPEAGTPPVEGEVAEESAGEEREQPEQRRREPDGRRRRGRRGGRGSRRGDGRDREPRGDGHGRDQRGVRGESGEAPPEPRDVEGEEPRRRGRRRKSPPAELAHPPEATGEWTTEEPCQEIPAAPEPE